MQSDVDDVLAVVGTSLAALQELWDRRFHLDSQGTSSASGGWLVWGIPGGVAFANRARIVTLAFSRGMTAWHLSFFVCPRSEK
jgi:hypothetical protein